MTLREARRHVTECDVRDMRILYLHCSQWKTVRDAETTEVDRYLTDCYL